MFLCELIKGVEKFTLPLSLLNCAPCAPSGLRALPIIDTHFTRLCAFILINKPLTRIFLSCVVSIVRYSLTPKNLGKAILRHFIPLKVIKFLPLQHYNKRPRKRKTSAQKSQKQH